jgi:polysaccharide biosynthesis transport protein
MLHSVTFPAATFRSPSAELSASATFVAARATVERQWPTMLTVILTALAAAAIYLLTAQPKYTATAALYVDTHKVQLLQAQQSLGGESPIDSSLIDSQVEILKSENIARAVIKNLNLLDDPEFSGPPGGLAGAAVALIERFAPGAPPSQYASTRQALTRFAKALTIKRLGLSYVIEIGFQSTDPQRAAKIANAVADAYTADSLESKYRSSRRAAGWLQDRLKELRLQASDAERAVVDYRAENNIVDAGGRLMNEQRLAELNTALTSAQAARAEAEARAKRVEEIVRAVDQKGISAETATVTDTLHNDVITRLRQQYLDLAEREADWTTRYGPAHLAVVNLRNQMREIRRSIADELKRIAEAYRSDLDIAKSHEETVKQGLATLVTQSNQTSQAQVTLHDLDANSQSYRALIDNFLQLYMVSVQQQSFPLTESRLITEASPPLHPSSPKLWLTAAIAVFGGGLLAFAVATFRELADRVIRTAGQIESALGVECLATTPFAKPPSACSGLGEACDWQARTFASDDRLLSYALESPSSHFAESLRAIKMAIDLRGQEKPNKMIGMTSALPNEGKSTLAAALARLIAQGDASVILVDGDLRNPSLSRRLTPFAETGLVEAILGEVALDQAVWWDPATALHFLPAGGAGRNGRASDLLFSRQAEAVFRALRSAYDYVIVDLSPLALIVDVRASAKFIDSYLFVVEWSRTKIDAAERALSAARQIHGDVMGAILNKVNLKAMRRYDGYRGARCDKRYGHVD